MSVEQQAQTVFPGTNVLEIVTPEGSQKEVRIRKATLRTLSPISAYLNKAMGLLQVDEKTKSKGGGVNLRDPKVILKLISEMQDDTIDILVKHCDLDKDAFLDLEIDQSVSIAMKIFEVNRDFFMVRVLPLIAPLLPADLKQSEGGNQSQATRS